MGEILEIYTASRRCPQQIGEYALNFLGREMKPLTIDPVRGILFMELPFENGRC